MQLIDRLGVGEVMRVPSDQLSSPTHAPFLAAAIAALPGEVRGLLHIAGGEVIDRYRFAVQAATALGLAARLLQPVQTSELGQRARRPLQAGLKVARLAALGLAAGPLDEALAEIREQRQQRDQAPGR
jgi:dTDP-4-dehydrorhamnose reductase